MQCSAQLSVLSATFGQLLVGEVGTCAQVGIFVAVEGVFDGDVGSTALMSVSITLPIDGRRIDKDAGEGHRIAIFRLGELTCIFVDHRQTVDSLLHTVCNG
jgi:hypothetical protein